MSPNKRIIISVTNDVLNDQRVLRMNQLFLDHGYIVTILGCNKYNRINPLPQVELLPLKFTKGVLFYLEYAIKQFLFLRKTKAAYLICCDPDTALGALMAKVFNIRLGPIIYDSHEYFTKVPELNNHPIKQLIWAIVEQWICNKAVLRLTVATELSKVLAKIYNQPFEVVRNVPALPKSELVAHPRNKVIIYQGVFNVGRGLEAAIDMMSYLPDYELWMCGSGDIEAELKQQAQGNKRIKFLGKLSPQELLIYTKQARYGLNLLSETSENYYYSLANKFFDYAACGVVSINPYFPEYIHYEQHYHHCILVQDQSAYAIAQLILHQSETEWTRMQNAGYLMMTEHNWNKEGKRLLGFINQIPSIS